MRLYVYLLEGRDWPVKDSYVKLQVGKYKSKTRFLKNTENPVWNEEFVFRVHDLEDELVVSVYTYDDNEPGLFNVSAGDLVGRVNIPVWSVLAEEKQSLPPTWFSVERPKNVKSIDKDCGKLLLALSLHGRDRDTDNLFIEPSTSEGNNFSQGDTKSASRKTPDGKPFIKILAARLEKFLHKKDETSPNDNSKSSDLSTPSDDEVSIEEPPNTSTFEESIELLQSRNENRETPDDLPGGILLDQTYVGSTKDLNAVIFGPNSEFQRNLVEIQGTTDFQEEPWKFKSDGDVPCLRRVITYTKAASKLVKAVKATEEQTYVKADGNEFAVLVNVNSPDVPYGDTNNNIKAPKTLT